MPLAISDDSDTKDESEEEGHIIMYAIGAKTRFP